jgi:hypothetical protein
VPYITGMNKPKSPTKNNKPWRTVMRSDRRRTLRGTLIVTNYLDCGHLFVSKGERAWNADEAKHRLCAQCAIKGSEVA